MFYSAFFLLVCLSVGWWFLADEENKMKKSKRSESAKKSNKKKNKKKPTQSKYKGYINGRDKRVRVPEENFKERLEELNDDDLQRLKDYLGIRKPNPDNLDYVYACPNCHVRITQRSDMLRVPHIWDEGNDIDMNAVFRWTTNLIERNGNVHCYRCNHDFDFKYRHDDSMILTLPMLKPGLQHRFLKREFRLLCLAYLPSISLFTGTTYYNGFKNKVESSQPVDLWSNLERLKTMRERDEGVVNRMLYVGSIMERVSEGKMIDVRKVAVFNVFRKDVKKYLGEDESLWKKRIDMLSEANKDLGYEFSLIYNLESASRLQLCKENTYDIAVYLKMPGYDSRDDFFILNETGYYAVLTEKIHLLCWALCGGNFLMGWWGQATYEPLGPNDWCDMYEEAESWKHRSHERLRNTSNKQEGFSKLISDGHFLGSWGHKFEPSKMMERKIEQALEGKYLHPQWLFIHDYPETEWNHKLRTGYQIRSGEKDYVYHSYKDKVFPPKAKELFKPVGMSSHRSESKGRRWFG